MPSPKPAQSRPQPPPLVQTSSTGPSTFTIHAPSRDLPEFPPPPSVRRYVAVSALCSPTYAPTLPVAQISWDPAHVTCPECLNRLSQDTADLLSPAPPAPLPYDWFDGSREP